MGADDGCGVCTRKRGVGVERKKGGVFWSTALTIHHDCSQEYKKMKAQALNACFPKQSLRKLIALRGVAGDVCVASAVQPCPR